MGLAFPHHPPSLRTLLHACAPPLPSSPFPYYPSPPSPPFSTRPLSPSSASPLRSTSPPPPPPSQPQHLVNLGNQLGGRDRGVRRGSPSPGSPEDACDECCRAVACSREGLRAAARPPRAGRAAVPRPAAGQAQLRPTAYQTPHLYSCTTHLPTHSPTSLTDCLLTYSPGTAGTYRCTSRRGTCQRRRNCRCSRARSSTTSD